jgi:hypothetical protein
MVMPSASSRGPRWHCGQWARVIADAGTAQDDAKVAERFERVSDRIGRHRRAGQGGAGAHGTTLPEGGTPYQCVEMIGTSHGSGS